MMDGINNPKKLIFNIKIINLASKFNITNHLVLTDLNIKDLRVIRR